MKYATNLVRFFTILAIEMSFYSESTVRVAMITPFFHKKFEFWCLPDNFTDSCWNFKGYPSTDMIYAPTQVRFFANLIIEMYFRG